MIVKKREDSGMWKRKNYIEIFWELALEETEPVQRQTTHCMICKFFLYVETLFQVPGGQLQIQ